MLVTSISTAVSTKGAPALKALMKRLLKIAQGDDAHTSMTDVKQNRSALAERLVRLGAQVKK